jgi:hypothetical protein
MKSAYHKWNKNLCSRAGRIIMKKGILRTFAHIFIIMAVCLTTGVALSSTALAQTGNNSDTKYTGKHGRNVRISIENGKASIVKGTIFEVRGSTIYMDGEAFFIGGANIKDQVGLPVKAKELYPGLQVHLLIRKGSVVRVSVKNFFRARKITDPSRR